MSELLHLSVAARRVGVTQKWLKAEATAGRVPCLRAGTSFLFDEATLKESLRSRASSHEQSPVEA